MFVLILLRVVTEVHTLSIKEVPLTYSSAIGDHWVGT
jgi:hypothetical protein